MPNVAEPRDTGKQMRPGKYLNHKFTPEQKKARWLWRRSDKESLAINDALMVITWDSPREELHARLDRRLDAIEKRRTRAKELFPEVDESFTIATMEMAL